MNTTLTAITGVAVGHAQDAIAHTGCTVVLLPVGTTCGVDVRGGGPGTRETDLLAPTAMVPHVDALLLTGGSAFGLAAADGVMRWLRERGRGFVTAAGPVPIVPAAVLFDLVVGGNRWPDAAMGYAACVHAGDAPVLEGSVGAGTGTTVGKLLGVANAMPGGVGSAAHTLPNGVTVAALAVTNAFGDVYEPDSRTIIAGARGPDGNFLDTARAILSAALLDAFSTNTTLCIIVTDATLDKAMCTKLAQMAQDALPRTIRPIHTPFDGDTVFAAATNTRPFTHLAVLGTAAADVLTAAIARSVRR